MEDQASKNPIWCIVANVVAERSYGPGGIETRRGTTHFAAGAKVYFRPGDWSDGTDKPVVIRRHRNSHRYVTMVISSEWLTNWRVELIYSPHVIKELAGYWDGSRDSKARAEKIMGLLNKYSDEKSQRE